MRTFSIKAKPMPTFFQSNNINPSMTYERPMRHLSQARQVLTKLCAIRDPRRKWLLAVFALLQATTPAWGLHQGKSDVEARYAAVVGIRTSADGFLCSATKIDTHRLLTAAHCLVDAQSGDIRAAFAPGGEILISNTPVLGPDDHGRLVVIENAQLAPAYATGLAAFRAYKADRLHAARERDINPAAMPNLSAQAAIEQRVRMRHHFAARYPDVALLRLRTATPEIPILPLAPKVPAPDTQVTLVGYGCAMPGGNSTQAMRRAWGTTRVIRADGVNFYSRGGQLSAGAPSLCPGNSGGPVLDAGRVIGVNTVVHGLNARLGARSNMAVNLQPLADWLGETP
jgi:hypothetical protein